MINYIIIHDMIGCIIHYGRMHDCGHIFLSYRLGNLNIFFPYFSHLEETKTPYREEMAPSPEEMEVIVTPRPCAPEHREIPEKEDIEEADTP